MIPTPFQQVRLCARHLFACAGLLVGLHATALCQVAVVGILEGRATLLRPAGKFELAEGVTLREADIVETAAASFTQIELADGVRVALGENSRLMLSPPGAAAARARLLTGWMKLTPGVDKAQPGDFLTPRAVLGALAGTCVVNSDAAQFALFVETGSVNVAERPGGAAPRSGRAGEFIAARQGAALASAARPAPDFVERMPRLFRDALPARAARFRDKPVAPRALGDVSYDDIAPWLQAEAAIRAPLVGAWRVRLADRSFKEAVLVNLQRHPEWRALVIPPKKPEPKARPIERPAEKPAEGASSPS